MSESFPKFLNHPVAKQEMQEVRHGSIEYYKAKENPIDRHLDHAREIALVGVADSDQEDFQKQLDPQSRRTHDALELKNYVISSSLPHLEDYESLNDFQGSLRKITRQNAPTIAYEERLRQEKGSEIAELFWEEWRSQGNKTKKFFEAIRDGKVDGLRMYGASGSALDVVGSCRYDDDKLEKHYRINIKVSPKDHPCLVVRELAERLNKAGGQLPAGFKMKTLRGDSNARDAVIVYVPESSFEGAAKIVTEHFQGNWQYHDRHADAGVFGGVALEAPDGSKFPGIRVAIDPPYLESPVEDTFNGLQAHILSLAVIEYVEQYYHGDKDRMMKHFMNDYDIAEQLWNTHFGRFYEKNARAVLGPKASMKNIAFFEE